MPAKPIPVKESSPPPPELRHLFSSFAELRARIRARKPVATQVIAPERHDVDPASLSDASRDK